ncbi:MAG: class I SAM-dependent methyltransferase [Candidatus Helarchaeota archaeon]
MNDKINWHERFTHQLKWTKELRAYIYKKYNFSKARKILEIGCGTGALLIEIGQRFNAKLFGIDIDRERIEIARRNLKKENISAELICTDILHNNFNEGSFDIIVTNLFFLWIKDISAVFREIRRLLRKDDILVIFTEPDYGGLIEYPKTKLKEALISNLKSQGANPEIGRMLSASFSGFKVMEQFAPSIPWMANNNKIGLLHELDFFKNILGKMAFDIETMRRSIEDEKYFLFNPSFSFVLKKI